MDLNVSVPEGGLENNNIIIGGTEKSAGNTIAFNNDNGVRVTVFYDSVGSNSKVSGNSILSNSIFANEKLGINLTADDLESGVVTRNDPGDSDQGLNNLQNFPILDSITRENGSITIKGKLNSEPGKTYKIQFFASGEPPQGGFNSTRHPQGKDFLGETGVTTDKDGNVTFEETFKKAVPDNQRIVATATDLDGNTSEFFSQEKPFEFLAKDTAYKDWTPGNIVKAESEEYTVDAVFDDAKTGFQAVGLTSDDLPPILGIRGTESTKPADILADLQPESVGINQFENNLEGVKNWLNDVSKNPQKNPSMEAPDITGHSLGGALTQLFAADFTSTGGKLGEIVTFNSPGIAAKYVDNFKAENAGSVIQEIISGDVVSMAGEKYLPGKYELFSYSDLNILNKHLNPVIANLVGYEKPIPPSIQKPDDVTSESFSSVDSLNLPSFHYNDPDYFAFRLIVSKLPLPFAPKLAADLANRGTVEADRKFIGDNIDKLSQAAEALINAPQDILDALNAAKQWASDAAFDAISQWTIEKIWEAVRQWGTNLPTPQLDTPVLQRNPLLSSQTSSAQPQKRVAVLNAEPPISAEPQIKNPAWAATTKWSDAAWAATTKWSDTGWETTAQWTAENWQETTQWTDEQWNATTQWTDEQWRATLKSSGTVPPTDTQPSGSTSPGGTDNTNTPSTGSTVPSDSIFNLDNLIKTVSAQGEPIYLLFDEDYYLQQNPGVAEAVSKGIFKSGLRHFLEWGQIDANRPFQVLQFDFDEGSYLADNLDVAEAVNQGIFRNGIEHFVEFGRKENRLSSVQFKAINQSFSFDETYYLTQNPDVAEDVAKGKYVNGVEHFIKKGKSEKRDFKILQGDESSQRLFFDENYYLAQNPGVADAVNQGPFRSAWQHFFEYGRFEGRQVSTLVDKSFS